MSDSTQPRPIPTQVQGSFVLWVVLFALTALGFVLSLLNGQSLFVWLPFVLLAAAAASGAFAMRDGRRWGRMIAGIAGGALALLSLISVVQLFVLVTGSWGAIVERGLQVSAIVLVAMPCVVLAVIVAATILMFRPPVNAYLG